MRHVDQICQSLKIFIHQKPLTSPNFWMFARRWHHVLFFLWSSLNTLFCFLPLQQPHCWLVSLQKASAYPRAESPAAPWDPAKPAEWEPKPKSSEGFSGWNSPLIHFLFTVQCHQIPHFYSSVFSGRWTRRRTTCCCARGLRRINHSRFSAPSQGVPHVDSLGVLQIVLFLSHTRGSSGRGQLILPSRTDGGEKRTYWTFTQRTLKMWEGKERRLSISSSSLKQPCKNTHEGQRCLISVSLRLPSFQSSFDLKVLQKTWEETPRFPFKFWKLSISRLLFAQTVAKQQGMIIVNEWKSPFLFSQINNNMLSSKL